MNVRLSVDVTLVDGADPEVVADRLFNLLADDPDDLPEIDSVDTYDFKVLT